MWVREMNPTSLSVLIIIYFKSMNVRKFNISTRANYNERQVLAGFDLFLICQNLKARQPSKGEAKKHMCDSWEIEEDLMWLRNCWGHRVHSELQVAKSQSCVLRKTWLSELVRWVWEAELCAGRQWAFSSSYLNSKELKTFYIAHWMNKC